MIEAESKRHATAVPPPYRRIAAPPGGVRKRASACLPVPQSAICSDLAVCVWIPRFALRCEEQRRLATTEQAAVLLAPDDLRRLWQVGPSARHAGVRPGMTVSQAVGLCPSLAVWEPDPVYYDERFSQLVKALGNVSPAIEPAELGRVFIGVDGLTGLYGEPEKQIEAVQAVLSPRDPTAAYAWAAHARLGWARGKFAAWVAATKAREGEAFIVTDEARTEFLASQPIGVLSMNADTFRRLKRLNIRTLHDLSHLPEVAIVSQFGNEGRRLWRLAAGAVVDPVIGRETPRPIVAEIEFPNPVADRAMLANALERLIERALRHPQRAGWRILEVGVRAHQEHGTSWTTRSTLKDPSADRDHIAAPLKTRLASTPPTGAVETLAVEFLTFVRGTDELQLFARDAGSTARAGRRRALRTAVHEMKTRFRRSSMYRIVEVCPGSRIPERRYGLVDYDP